STDSKLQLTLGSTIKGQHDYEAIYEQKNFGPLDLLFFRGKVRYFTDLTTRFWGIGNDTKSKAESSFVERRSEGIASLGAEFPLQEILSVTSIGPGRLPNVPSSNQVFPDVPGMEDRLTLLAHRLVLTFDTRDSKTAAMRGVLVEGYYEVGDSTLASDVSFQK